MNLYYAEGEQQMGPIGKVELQTLIKAKKVNAKTLVWQPGMANWQELGVYIRNRPGKDVPKQSSKVPVPQSVCSECGRAFADDEMIRFQDSRVCSGCKPVFIQKIK